MNFLSRVRSMVSSNPDQKQQEGQLQSIMKLIQTESQNGPIKLNKREEKDLNLFFKQALEIIHKERSLGTNKDKITEIISTMIHENRILTATGLIYNSELLDQINSHLFFKKSTTHDEARFFHKTDHVETEVSVKLLSAKRLGIEALKQYLHEMLDDRGSIPIETFLQVVLNKYNKNKINADDIIALIEETQKQIKSLTEGTQTPLSEVLKERSEFVLQFILTEIQAGNFLRTPLEKQSFQTAIKAKKITETSIVREIKKQLGVVGDSCPGEDEEEDTLGGRPMIATFNFEDEEDDTEIPPPTIATTSSSSTALVTATAEEPAPVSVPVPVPTPVIECEYEEPTSTTELKELFNSLLKLDNNFYADNIAENIIHLNRIAKEFPADGGHALDRMLIQNCFKHLFQEITREDSTLKAILVDTQHETKASNILSAFRDLFASPDTLKCVNKETHSLFKKASEKIPSIHSTPPVRHLLAAEEVKSRKQLRRAEKQIQFLENPENQRKFLNGLQVLKFEGLRNEYRFVSKRFSTITERVHTKESVLKNVETFSDKVNKFFNEVTRNPGNRKEAHRSYWGGVEKVE